MSAHEKKPYVFIARGIPHDALHRLQQHCNVQVYDTDNALMPVIPFDEFKRLIVGADAALIHHPEPINKEILDIAGPQLKVVGTASVGLDHVDLEECKRRGVKVGYTPDVLTNAAAEMAITLTLATARRLPEALKTVFNGQWGTKWCNGLWLSGRQISGSVIGIVGLGRIGFAAAKRFKSFEPSKIVYCGHGIKPHAKEIGAQYVSFKDLLNMSDFVIVTSSLNSTSKNLFNGEAFKEMKKSSIFVNVSRGGLVDQDALYNALNTNQIGAACLDVTTPEPLPTDHKLLSLSNCIVCPHLSSATVETRNAMYDLTVDNILAGLNNEPLPSSAY